MAFVGEEIEDRYKTHAMVITSTVDHISITAAKSDTSDGLLISVGEEEGRQAVIFPADTRTLSVGNIDISQDKTRHQKDQLLRCNFFLTSIIIIYCLKSEYLNTTTDLLIVYSLNAQMGCHSKRTFVYVITRP